MLDEVGKVHTAPSIAAAAAVVSSTSVLRGVLQREAGQRGRGLEQSDDQQAGAKPVEEPLVDQESADPRHAPNGFTPEPRAPRQ